MTSATPRAPRRPHEWQRPTGPATDAYAWLRDKDDPETLAYLAAENTFATEWFQPRTATIDSIFGEIKQRVKEDDSSYPVLHRGWWYASRTETGKSYAIHSRGVSAETALNTVLLDENIEATGHDYFSLSAFDVSHSGHLLAWSSDTDGSEMYTLRIRDLSTNTDLPDEIPNTTWGGTAWSANDEWLFYVVPDEAMRPHQVWRHKVGTASSDDVLVLEDADERFFVGVSESRSGKWIMIESGSKTSSECWVIDSLRPTDSPRSLATRRDNVEYQADHWNGIFAITTNLDADDFRVMTMPENGGEWTELIPHSASKRIVQFDCFETFAVMQRWESAQQVLSLVTTNGMVSPLTILNEPHEVELDVNPDYAPRGIRLTYQSLTTPNTVAWYSLSDSSLTTLKLTEVLNCDLSHYVSQRLWATATDGTRVPVDIVHHRDTPLDGTAPGLVYAYGAYEISLAPWFSIARLSLLDRGWVWALVHPRGGGEMGRNWYLDGKFLNKRNTFTDTIDAASHLADTKVCNGSQLVVRGGSAGGLLVGACITMNPARFVGAIAEVPFVDVVTTMSDPSMPLTVTEWEEWGDPRTEPFASYIQSYSPYDNTTNVVYPQLYVTAGLNDPRVSYHEPTKWVAKMRHESPDTTVVFTCEMGAGHGGPSGRYEQWRDEARTLAFAMSCVQ
jgi:oligopeptidase B